MSPEYLTVSQAAARLGVSERTIQRRCKSGKLKAELVTDADGEEWRIDPASVPTSDDTGADSDDRVTTPQKVPVHSQNESVTTERVPTVATPDDIVTPPVPTGDDSPLLTHLQAENAFLRSMVEQHQRSEAELRAALREALKAMPKALGEGNSAEPQTTVQDVQSPSSVAAPVKGAPAPAPSSQARKLSPWQRVVARVLGIR